MFGRVVAIAVGSLIGVAPLAAQSVSGTVVLSDSVTPAAGVIVVATDARGGTAARALTTARGEFLIRLPAAGRYGFTLLRIGFRPTRLPALSVGAGETEVARFILSATPVTLASVNVREQETCRVSADTGFMVARVWEEARKAMLSTQLNPGDAPLFAEWIEYDRLLDSTARLVREQRVHIARNPTTHAFHSRPAELLDTSGYVVADSMGTTFYAPDAEVLLSDLFAAGHCFRLVSSRQAPGTDMIGVGFQPARSGRDKREIQGTLWVDRTSAELRSLEFQYTNLPDVMLAAGAGGTVEFLRLPDGNWLVSRWHVRMPRIGQASRTTNNGLGRVTMSRSNIVVRGIQITGGEVTRVTRHDTLVHEATGPAVVVQVVSRDSLVPSTGASLTLDGTDYTATADTSGRIRLTPVLAGHYRARVSTPLMDSLGMPPVVREVDARDDTQNTHVDSLTLPPPRDALIAACTRDSVRNGEGMLHGRVRDERARALEGVAVTVTWKANFAATGAQVAHSEKTAGAQSNDAGYWRVCGVPRETSLSVRVVTDSGSDSRSVRLDLDREFAAVDLVVRHAEPGVRAEAAGATPHLRALVEIAVTELGGSPLPDATVEIESAGQTRTVVTGPGGRALVPDIAPGQLIVRARRLGFKPGQLAVTVEAGRNTVPILLSTVSLPTLDTVRVVGDRPLAGLGRHDEFETRRLNRSATTSFTREDILKRNPVDVWQMLTSVPSVKIVDSASVTAESARGMVPASGTLAPRKCYMSVMVDGLVLSNPPSPKGGQMAFDLRRLPKPDEIYGIEVFAGPASIPVQYSGAGADKWCGLIAIWTR